MSTSTLDEIMLLSPDYNPVWNDQVVDVLREALSQGAGTLTFSVEWIDGNLYYRVRRSGQVVETCHSCHIVPVGNILALLRRHCEQQGTLLGQFRKYVFRPKLWLMSCLYVLRRCLSWKARELGKILSYTFATPGWKIQFKSGASEANLSSVLFAAREQATPHGQDWT